MKIVNTKWLRNGQAVAQCGRERGKLERLAAWATQAYMLGRKWHWLLKPRQKQSKNQMCQLGSYICLCHESMSSLKLSLKI